MSEKLREAADDEKLIFSDVTTGGNACVVSGEYSVNTNIEINVYLEHTDRKEVRIQTTFEVPKEELQLLPQLLIDFIIAKCPLD